MNTKSKVSFIIVYIILAALVVVLDFGDQIWLDESFTVHMTKHSLGEIIDFTSIDVHPPLYYFILKPFVLLLGYNILVYHIFSAIPFMAMLLIVGLFTSKEISPKAGILSMVVLCAVPHTLTYAVEIRMYSWCQLFVICSVIIAYKLAKKDNTVLWVLFCIVNALAAYTHYFAGMAVMIVSICLIVNILITKTDVKKRFIKWLVANIGTVVLYIPWLTVFISQSQSVKESFWIAPFNFADLGEYAEFVFGEFVFSKPSGYFAIIYAAILCLAIVLLIVKRKKLKTFQFAVLNLCVFFGYIIGGIILSVVFTPVFIARYIAVVLPCIWLFVIYTVLAIENNKIFIATAIITVIMFIYNYYVEFNYRLIESNSTLYDSIKDEITADDIVYHNSAHSLSILSVYMPEHHAIITDKDLEIEKFKSWHEMSPNIEVQSELNIPDNKTVWVILDDDEASAEDYLNAMDYAFDTSVLDYLSKKGYKIEQIGERVLPAGQTNKEFMLYKCHQ